MATIKKIQLRREVLSLTTWHETQTDVSDETDEPTAVIERMTETLARELGCTEAQAQRILFGQDQDPRDITA